MVPTWHYRIGISFGNIILATTTYNRSDTVNMTYSNFLVATDCFVD